MNYNPENIEVKRPRKGEIWTAASAIALFNVVVHGRYTVSALYALGRREKLSECDDLYSMVMWSCLSGDSKITTISFSYEKGFVEDFKFVKVAK